MSMFKKVNRNYRLKKRDYDEERRDSSGENEDDGDRQYHEQKVKPIPKIVSEPLLSFTSSKKDSNMPRNRSVLSFEDELQPDDGEAFKVKKTTQSRKLARQRKEEKRREQVEIELRALELPDEEHISAPDYLEEVPKEFSDAKLKKLRNELRVLNGDEAEEMEKELSDDDTSATTMLKKGIIPDATAIHYAKKQRELAKLRMENDEDSNDSQPVRTKADTSRLIREEDNDEIDDDEKRVKFVGHRQREEELAVLRNEFLAAEHGSDRDSDEENEWEQQQIKKVVAQASGAQEGSRETDSGWNYSNGGDSSAGPLSGLHGGMRPLNLDPQSITLDRIKHALGERLSELETVNSGHRQELDKCRSELTDSLANTERCQRELPGLSERFAFYQEMRGYVRDLVDCFNEKMPKIEYLERRVLEVYQERSERLATRRRQDVRDQADDIALSCKAGSVQVTTNSKEVQQKQERSAEMKARRLRRRRKRESSNVVGHNEGMSSDDEEQLSHMDSRKKDLEHVGVDAQSLFEDVMDEFCDASLVMKQFSRWRSEQTDSYTEAFIGLCIPRLITPLVRSQMISWNPLQANCRPLERFPWFQALVSYGSSDMDNPDSTNQTSHITDDVKIIPSIIERLLLVKLKDFVVKVWDPMSTTETILLSNLIRSISNEYPTINMSSKSTQQLLRAVVEKIEQALNEDVFIPLYQKHVLENRHGAAYLFLQRRFWSAVKLLSNILSWNDLLSPAVTQHLACDCLLNRYIMIGMVAMDPSQETVAKVKTIAAMFPRDWFFDVVEAQELQTPACLNIFVRNVEQMALHLKADKDSVRQLIRVLETIRAEKQVKSLAKLVS